MTSTAGRMDLLVDEPQEARGIFFLFFLDTVGMCRISPINTFLFFLSPSVFFFSSSSSFVFMFFPPLLSLLSGIFVLLKRTQGWIKPE